ncbi:PPE domain-containing protein [Nocardia alni]|uniref:PPE domain-containing protein n=1 Tax=Nocardia alni TaxID=2815723 RepID=UPI001C226DF1|nr:PPE domain-containing protein [Nocardia alni]
MTVVEPPVAGFTGVIWAARTPARLVRDIANGPGPAATADAVLAWRALATGIGAAAADFGRIIDDLGGMWLSRNSDAVLPRLRVLRDWLADAAATAAGTADAAEYQGVSQRVAFLGMANIVDEDALPTTFDIGLGGPLLGAAAELECRLAAAGARATRVMQVYEAAGTPLVEMPQQASPPAVINAAAGSSGARASA